MINLKIFRDPAPGLADLLNFASVIADGTVLGKDGSLMGGWYYQGHDSDTSTHAELNAVSARMNAALLKLGAGWMLHCDAIRVETPVYPMDGSAFPDPVSRHLDAERRAMFEAAGTQFETIYALILTWLPPSIAESRLYTFLVDDPESKQINLGQKSLEYFERTLADLELQLSSVFRLTRIRSRLTQEANGKVTRFCGLLQHLQHVITGENHAIRLPSTPTYIDKLLGFVDMRGGLAPKIGKRYLSVLSIEGLPEESYPVILRNLDTVPVEYRWSTRFIFIDRAEAIATVKSHRKRWKQKIRGFRDSIMQNTNGPLDHDAIAMVADADGALAEASSGYVAHGYYTSVLVTLHEDPSVLAENTKLLKTAVQNLGFSVREEDTNCVEAWLGSIPGHGTPNVRRPLIHTGNLADLLPTSCVWSGHRHCPSPMFPKGSPPLMLVFTKSRTAFRLNLHVSDVGHTLIVGPTGSGKSTLLQNLQAQWLRYPGARVSSFDKGQSGLALTLGVGGVHHHMGAPDSDLSICPLAELDSEPDIVWAEGWMEQALALQGVKIAPRERAAISEAMRRLQSSSVRSLTDYYACLQDRELRQALEHYCGRFLDGRSDNLRFSRSQCFEMQHVMGMGDKNLIPAITYLFRKIEKAADGSPTLLPIDEAWIALGHEVFRNKIREWLKEMRKSNIAVVLATQSISDAERSGILDIILEGCPTKILLPNPMAEDEASRSFYVKAGLNDQKISMIKNMTPKMDYLLVNPDGDRMFQLGCTPFSKSFTGASSKEDIAAVHKLHKQYGSKWITPWLEHRGVK